MGKEIDPKLKEILLKEDNFFIVSHYLPDGDSVGSSLAMANFLNIMNKNVFVYCRDQVPIKYKFLDKRDIVSVKFDRLLRDTTLLVLDCSDLSRTGLTESQLKSFNKTVNLDHHITNEYFGDINYVNTEASATGEIVYEVIRSLGMEIDDEIALCLYVAILTDTGSFKFENTTPSTHHIVAELLNYDINPSLISQIVFDEKPLSYFLLLKKILSTLELWENNRIATLTVNKEMLLQEGVDIEILDGMVNYAKNIDTVEIAIIFFIESENEIKVGLRSKKTDVSEIAAEFTGGGHIRAAGFRIKGKYSEVKSNTVKRAIDLIKRLEN